MISGMAAPITVLKTGCHSLPGRIRLTASSGMATSSSTTVCEPVARIPSVSHVSSMLTPSVANGTAAWMTCGPSGASSQRMLVTTMSPAGAPLAGCLAPGHPESCVGLRGRAVRLDPVRRARRHEHQLLVGDLRQHRCGHAAAVAPDLCGDEVGVHGERERGGRAAPGQGRQDGAGLGVGRTAAAEVARDEHRHEAARRAARSKPSSTNAPLSSSAAASVESVAATSSAAVDPSGSSARRPSSGDPRSVPRRWSWVGRYGPPGRPASTDRGPRRSCICTVEPWRILTSLTRSRRRRGATGSTAPSPVRWRSSASAGRC